MRQFETITTALMKQIALIGFSFVLVTNGIQVMEGNFNSNNSKRIESETICDLIKKLIICNHVQKCTLHRISDKHLIHQSSSPSSDRYSISFSPMSGTTVHYYDSNQVLLLLIIL